MKVIKFSLIGFFVALFFVGGISGAQQAFAGLAPCESQSDCSFLDNECATFTCEERGCVVESESDALCNDDDLCNGTYSCDAIMGCVEEQGPVTCETVECGTNLCDSGTGSCVVTPADGDCSVRDNECATFTCNFEGMCRSSVSDEACNDDDLCNGTSFCSPMSGCVEEQGPVTCETVECGTNDCNPGTGNCEITPVDDDCQDGVECTVNSCNDGTCDVSLNDDICNDGIACTVGDHCAPGIGCTADVFDDLACGDANECTVGDHCAPGIGCTADFVITCSGVECGTNECNPVDGLCDFTPDDGACDISNECIAGSCDISGDCVEDPVPDGLECDGGGGLCTSGECVPVIDVAIDIKPQSCPNSIKPTSNGVLPVAILGTDSFDVTQVDVDTITLEGVPPIRHIIRDVATPLQVPTEFDENSCTDEGPDGFDDLTLKFNMQEVIAALEPVSSGDVKSVELDGLLLDGTFIEGYDIIIIR